MVYKIGLLDNFAITTRKSQEKACVGVSFSIKVQTGGLQQAQAQVLSCEFYEIFTISFCRTPPVAASVVH